MTLLAAFVAITAFDRGNIFRSQPPVNYYVSPTGNDANPGTFELPFATLERARVAAHSINANMQSDIIIYLRGGVYWLDAPLAFTAEDSGNNGHNIMYAAYRDEKPVLSGGVQITGWSLYDPVKNIYQARVDSALETRQLYVNGARAVRARSEENPAGFLKTATGYTITLETMQSWRNPNDIEFVYQQEWKSYRCGVSSIDGSSIIMKQPCFTNAQRTPFTTIDTPLWIENAYELLDAEGEWYLDRSAGLIYYKPRFGEKMSASIVVAPRLETLITGTGTLDEPIHNLGFTGLIFSDATWLGPARDVGYVEIQANYFQVGDGPLVAQPTPANVSFTAARSIRFERNTFTRLGATALAFETGSQDNQVIGNRFYDISGIAIRIGGTTEEDRLYNQAAVRNNIIANNLIHDIGLEFFGAPAIFLGFTSDTVVSHNELSYLPYSGISVGWGWGHGEQGEYPRLYSPSSARHNRIQYNYIHHFMQVMQDGGGIYTLGNQPRSIISNNYIHDQIGRFGGIYLDEATRGFSVTRNVFAAIPFWINTNVKSRDNFAYNNYSSTAANLLNQNSEIALFDNVIYANADWPIEAKTIILNAGLESDYANLLNGYDYANLAGDDDAVVASSIQPGFTAALGNDGDVTTAWVSGAGDQTPYWQIDLGGACFIHRIELIAPQVKDEPIYRRNFEVLASNSRDFSPSVVLARQGADAFAQQKPWSVEFQPNEPYRYLRIKKTVSEAFSLAEFRAWSSIENRYCNVAVDASTYASTQISNQFSVNNANDGNSESGWSPASVSDDPNPWWQVDLGAAYQISTIELVTRQDLDQPETRANITIWVSNDCDFANYFEVGYQPDTPLPYQSVWTITVNQFYPFRFIRVSKTISQYLFVSELRVWHDSAQPSTTILRSADHGCNGPRSDGAWPILY